MGPEPEIGKLEKEKGSLYTLVGKHTVRKHLSKVSIANGLAWNVPLKTMYYIDSPKRTVDQYDYDISSGEISKLITHLLSCIFDFQVLLKCIKCYTFLQFVAFLNIFDACRYFPT